MPTADTVVFEAENPELLKDTEMAEFKLMSSEDRLDVMVKSMLTPDAKIDVLNLTNALSGGDVDGGADSKTPIGYGTTASDPATARQQEVDFTRACNVAFQCSLDLVSDTVGETALNRTLDQLGLAIEDFHKKHDVVDIGSKCGVVVMTASQKGDSLSAVQSKLTDELFNEFKNYPDSTVILLHSLGNNAPEGRLQAQNLFKTLLAKVKAECPDDLDKFLKQTVPMFSGAAGKGISNVPIAGVAVKDMTPDLRDLFFSTADSPEDSRDLKTFEQIIDDAVSSERGICEDDVLILTLSTSDFLNTSGYQQLSVQEDGSITLQLQEIEGKIVCQFGEDTTFYPFTQVGAAKNPDLLIGQTEAEINEYHFNRFLEGLESSEQLIADQVSLVKENIMLETGSTNTGANFGRFKDKVQEKLGDVMPGKARAEFTVVQAVTARQTQGPRGVVTANQLNAEDKLGANLSLCFETQWKPENAVNIEVVELLMMKLNALGEMCNTLRYPTGGTTAEELESKFFASTPISTEKYTVAKEAIKHLLKDFGFSEESADLVNVGEFMEMKNELWGVLENELKMASAEATPDKLLKTWMARSVEGSDLVEVSEKLTEARKLSAEIKTLIDEKLTNINMTPHQKSDLLKKGKISEKHLKDLGVLDASVYRGVENEDGLFVIAKDGSPLKQMKLVEVKDLLEGLR